MLAAPNAQWPYIRRKRPRQDLISSDGNLTINCGRLLSSEAQVTLIQDNISTGCAGTGLGSGGFDQGVDIGSGGIGEPVVTPYRSPVHFCY